MVRVSFSRRWLGCLLGLLLSAAVSQAQTTLRAGDVVITGLNAVDPDVFAFAPLVDVAAGTQLYFTDNGWMSSGSFRSTEGVATYTVPAGGLSKGTLVTYRMGQSNPGFSVTSQFLLSNDGDQLLVYQGSASNPTFIYGLTTRGTWTDATSANTSALPPGLTAGVSAVALPWSNGYQNQASQRQGGVNSLRAWFSNSANWVGVNSSPSSTFNFSWYATAPTNTSLTVDAGQAPALTELPRVAGQGLSRVRQLTFTDPNLASPVSGTFPLSAPCSGLAGTRRVTLTAKFSANSLVSPGGGQPSVELHNMGEAEFTGRVLVQLSTDYNRPGTSAFTPIVLDISKVVPEKTYVLDLTTYFSQIVVPGNASRLTADVTGYLPGAASYASNFRLNLTLEESYYALPAPVVATTATTGTGMCDPTQGPCDNGRLEQYLTWQPSCLTEEYQIQVLKLTAAEVSSNSLTQSLLSSTAAWRQRATTLDVQTTDSKWLTTLAEGYGTYYYRVRACANRSGGTTNPENWGAWSAARLLTLNPATGVPNLANLNWIYSRTFTEGGRVAEKITYANGLLQTRQTLTRLASTRQVIGLQTVQDYVGRDALQSLPIPVVGGDPFLSYKPALLAKTGTTGSTRVSYQALDFDDNTKVSAPAQARESGYYNSATPVYATAGTPPAGTPALNEGVADAEGYPFARTLFTADGTNRVREQGGVGLQLGLGQGHTVRTYYASVAQDELTRLMGKEAPQAGKTYKTMTIDPNGTTSVTYQTLEGKTIATALAGAGNSGSALVPLPSAPTPNASSDRIEVVMTEKSDYNGIGSVGRQLLVVPYATAVNLTYTLTPGTFTDGCSPAVCSTCDYTVTIKCSRLEDGLAVGSVYTRSDVLKANCVASGAITLTGTFNVPEAGTYVIEKKVTAYNTDPGTGTPYVDTQAQALQQASQDYLLRAPWKGTWDPAAQTGTKGILDYLNVPNLPTYRDSLPDVKHLYSFLSRNYTLQGTPGQQYYEVPFGCAGEKVQIPVVTTACDVPCNATAPGFEAIFASRLGLSASAYWSDLAAAMPSFTGTAAGSFDALVSAMLADNSPTSGYAQRCADLRACWIGQVESYSAQQAASSPAVGGPPADLLRNFLTCAQQLLPTAGTPPTPRPYTSIVAGSTAASTVSPTQLYHTAYYVTNQSTNVCLSCLRVAMGRAIRDDAEAQGLLSQVTPEQASAYARCIQSGGATAQSPTNPPITSPQLAAGVSAQLLGSCEQRRAEFRRLALAVNATLSPCEADRLADELVRKCQQDATLTAADFETTTLAAGSSGQPVPVEVMTQAATQRLRNLQVGRAQVKVLDLNDNCTPQTTACPITPLPRDLGDPGLYMAVRPTQAAIALLGYADALLQAANRKASNPLLNNVVQGCPAQPIHEGVGEATLDAFSYLGPINATDDNLSAYANFGTATPAGRARYWAVTLLDQPKNTSLHPGQVYFSLYLPGQAGGTVLPNLPRLCLPTASEQEAPGIPQAPVVPAGYAAASSFWLESTDPANPLTSWNVASLSAPYARLDNSGQPEQVNLRSGLNPGEGLYVRVTLKSQITVEAALHVARTNTLGYDMVNWRQPVCFELDTHTTYRPSKWHACLSWEEPPVLDLTTWTGLPATQPVLSCQEVAARQLLAAIGSQQQQLTSERVTAYRASYAQACALPASLQDRLTLRYALGYHHYTLYYYDRAGQLMQTVPPAGVRPLDVTDPAHPDYPSHQLVTRYVYNSLGQLVRQNSPDGGTTRFYYNSAGQLRYSLNDKQLGLSVYSFTCYDALGRVVQVGESSENFSLTAADPVTQVRELAGPLANLDNPAVPPATGTVRNQTVTTYSTQSSVTYLDGTPQRYFTNRVSSTTAYAHAADAAGTAPVVTTYSYDPHGNVEWLCQDIPELGKKYVKYQYDLISNKVTQVAYQAGQVDQFFHRYRYDDDHRITGVQTSADGVVWETDAEYQYYAHGPLKRTMLGDDRVQGLDYVYTLQGWIKALNHPDLNKAQDPGQDGVANGVGADAFGSALSYYAGDYVNQSSYLNATTTTHADLVPTAGQSLYNGNIATWASRNAKLTTESSQLPNTGEVYQYDQLNRLLASTQSSYAARSGQATKSWAATNQYGTSYSYDANGNLLTLTRQWGSQALDNLSYVYNTGQSNQLQYVSDTVPANVSAEDVDEQGNRQGTPNYRYDALGNLTSDTQGGVVNLDWTPYGKPAKIVRTDGSLLTYRYDAAGNRVSKLVKPTAGTNLSTYYVRDATGNVLAVYEGRQAVGSSTAATLSLVEQPLYGSSRLGERKLSLTLSGAALPAGPYYGRTLGLKLYELTDHLGNVRAVVTDQKTSTLDASTGQPGLSSVQPVLNNYYNYYAFGMLQPGRYGYGNSTANGGYRFGYNGKEKDNNGELGLTNYDYGARAFNPGIGRFLSVDQLAKKYLGESNYAYCSNNPLIFTDPDGREKIVVIGGGDNSPSAQDRYKFVNFGMGQALRYAANNKTQEPITILVTDVFIDTNARQFIQDQAKVYESFYGAPVNVVMLNNGEELTNYVNSKSSTNSNFNGWGTVSEGRASDPITAFSVFGHGYANIHVSQGGVDAFEPGHGTPGEAQNQPEFPRPEHSKWEWGIGEVTKISPEAFATGSVADFYTCNAATPNSEGVSLASGLSLQLTSRNTTTTGFYGRCDYNNYGFVEGKLKRLTNGLTPASNLPIGGEKTPGAGRRADSKASIQCQFRNGKLIQVIK